MPARRVGILHPGQMGSLVAVTLQNSGNEVYWASEGRSPATRARAEELGLRDAGTLAGLCEICPTLVSVCPPEFADSVADAALARGFRGLFIDANAIAPERARHIDVRMRARGASFVDGGIIGPASRTPPRTWIFLSGAGAAEAASYFSGGPIQPEVIGGNVGQASALKMCYAAYSKGSIALLAATLAAADKLGVRGALERQWERSSAGAPPLKSLKEAAPKAWRWAPEMREVAATLESAGMPPEFHEAAARVYTLLESFKDAGDPQIEEIVRALTSTLVRRAG